MTSRDVTVLLKADLRPYIEAMNKAAALLARLHFPANGAVRMVDRHHPRPLPIDGHAYHQRRRNRRRR